MNVLATKLKVYRIRGGHTMRSVAKEIGVSASVVCHAENHKSISHESRRLISEWVSGERQRKALEDHQKPLSALPVDGLVYSLPDGLITGSLPASPNFYAFNKTKAEKDKEAANNQCRLGMMNSIPPVSTCPTNFQALRVAQGIDMRRMFVSYWISIGLVALIASWAVWMSP